MPLWIIGAVSVLPSSDLVRFVQDMIVDGIIHFNTINIIEGERSAAHALVSA